MTNTRHTPGPWVVDEVYEDDEQRCIGIVKEGQGYIAGIHILASADTGNTEFTAEDEGNAHLIAAAPAMYEALKGMVSMYDSLNKSNKHDGACPCYHCQARTALAQAEGSKP